MNRLYFLCPLFDNFCNYLHYFRLFLRLNRINLTLLLNDFRDRCLFAALLLFRIRRERILFINTFLFPLSTIPLRRNDGLLFLNISPLIRLKFSLKTTYGTRNLRDLLRKSLNIRSFTFPTKRVQRRISIRVKHDFVRIRRYSRRPRYQIAFLRTLRVLIRRFLYRYTILNRSSRVVFITSLSSRLVRGLFLLTYPRILVMINSATILTLLLNVMALRYLIGRFIMRLLGQFVPMRSVRTTTLQICIFDNRASPIVIRETKAPRYKGNSFRSRILSL